MKKKYLLLAATAFLFSLHGIAQEKKAAKDPVSAETASGEKDENEELVGHKVAMGETIMLISKKYKVKPKDIYEYNPDATEGISANQYLQIPMHRSLAAIKKNKVEKFKLEESTAQNSD